MSDEVRYPAGPYVKPSSISVADREGFIIEIAGTPAKLRAAVKGLTDSQLDTPYRDGGWTVRQVVHHLPDSHLNAYLRFKFALTENEPVIHPYAEELWAELPEAKSGPVEISLLLLDAIHARWIAAIRALPESSFRRKYIHPENGPTTLAEQLANYAWHGRNHVAQITALRSRKGWV